MSRLEVEPLPSYIRDVKRLLKKHVDITALYEVIDLIVENSPASLQTLEQRHNKHRLKGPWKSHFECHVCNAGDWLLIWSTDEEVAYLERTGSHDELFK